MGLFGSRSKEKADLKAQAKSMAEGVQVGASGVQFSSVFSCASTFAIAPKPIEVGVKRSKELKNKIVVSGTVKGGQFAKGETVAVVGGDGVVKTVTLILDLIPDDGTLDFTTELNANMHKKEAGPGANAWLILDVEDGIFGGDLIAKL